MKRHVPLLGILLLSGSAATAQTVAAAEKQALAKQLNQLLHDPAKPKQEVKLALDGCHVQQIIRDNDADVQMSQPVNVSVSKGSSDWAVNVGTGRFEMKMGFDWSEVTELSYEPQTEDGQHTYELKVKRRNKTSTVSTEMTLFTTDEAVVKDLVRRLERVRQSCR
ncbi:hypothetical protein [Hymenobacter psychrotolerans]|uniref:DUF4468 domain-containing protein n=1 Tax=Hymenobacter psychrotolerans DSM 18569 TaxID=1121959 RepID=A0A1M7C272_9BACT|nr:hypothetical protein [Hymenobacter psychrotolerans]SHL61345.1 hypothetical protein SAMN02746009_03079 [Hymenobacter psychrotolerans DSM 18569]